MKQFKYYDIILGLFVAVILISNVASSKILVLGPIFIDIGSFIGLIIRKQVFYILQIGPLTFDGGTILFPISYIFGDILTEVYGYKRSRRVIWTGFFCAFLMSVVFMIVGKLPPAAGWENQEAYDKILGLTPRIVLASLIAYFSGEFSNAYTLAKMKIFTKGRWLWSRTIGSTIIGEGIDTVLFVMIAFYGVFPGDLLLAIMISNYVFKVGFEVLCTPLTYRVVGFLKSREGVDTYDRDTNFNPFALRK